MSTFTGSATAGAPPQSAARANPRLATPGPLETAGVVVLFLILGVLVFIGHLHRGSFYYDDWANSAITHYSGGFGGAINAFWHTTSYRPLLVLYEPVVHTIFGDHQHALLLWAIVLAALMSASFYVFLRTLNVERVHAAILGALVMLFPLSDSLRLWTTSSVVYLALSFYLIGTVVALHGLQRQPGRGATGLHAVAIVLYLLSIFTYEIAAPAILLSLAFYRREVAWKRAIRWWLCDVVAAVLALVLVTSGTTSLITPGTPQKVLSLGGELNHVKTIADQGLHVLAQAAEPFGSPAWPVVLAILAAVAVAGLATLSRLPAGHEARTLLRRWLFIWVAAIVAIIVGYVMIVPANPYYSPLEPGVGNRVNAFSALGYVTLIYATFMILATVLTGSRRVARPVRIAVVGVLVVVLAAGYVHRLTDDQHVWDRASEDQLHLLAVLKQGIPHPPANSTLYTVDYPAWTGPGIPVFASSWDLNGAVKVTYRQRHLSGYPLFAPTALKCTSSAVYPQGGGYGPKQSARYGRAYVIDVTKQAVVPITGVRQCRRAAALLKTASS